MPSAIAATTGADPQRGQHIVDAAIRLILRDGIDGVRAQALAREASISIATPYHYFTALDDIVLAAFDTADAAASQHRAHTIERAGDDPVWEPVDTTGWRGGPVGSRGCYAGWCGDSRIHPWSRCLV